MNLYKADFDKPHRCPECWTIPDKMWDPHPPWLYQKVHYFWIYRCTNGHRFTKMHIPFRKDPVGRGWNFREELKTQRVRRSMRSGN